MRGRHENPHYCGAPVARHTALHGRCTTRARRLKRAIPQEWIAAPATPGDPWLQLVSMTSKKCLGVKDVSYDNGAPLQVWTCSMNRNQRWNIS
ncbi:RICIN domain-containing protein [Micromonospora fulviviridis]|uniref:RICIN domain-containing protein n=1 Tax=Micromonospora fulviviridis TaxID=47860 RepID=UPI003570E7B2